MAFSHGIAAEVFLGAYDMGGYVTDHNADVTFDTTDTTTINKTAKTYLVGLGDGVVTLGGLLDPATVPGDQGFHDALGGQLVMTYGIAGVAIGDRVLATNSIVGTYSQGGGVGGAVTWSFNGQADEGLVHGVSLHANATETGIGAFASVDQSAATANGGFSTLHVIGGTFTSATIEVEDSVNDSVWASLTSHSVTGTVGEVATVSGNVDRYLRANITAFTGTDITFVISFSRYR